MRHYYIKDFVNVRYWVTLDFDSLIPFTESGKSSVGILRVIGAAVMSIAALMCLIKLWWAAFAFCLILTLFFFLLGWLQRKMDVVFPKKFTLLTVLALLVASVVSMGLGKHIDDVNLAKAADLAEQKRQAEIAEQQEQERIAREKEILRQEMERQRQDSLSFHVKQAEHHLKGKKRNDAIEEYKSAVAFANTTKAFPLYLKIATLYFANKQYDAALAYYQKYDAAMPHYQKMNGNHSMKDTVGYNMAVCYASMGSVAAAVNSLRFTDRTRRVEVLFNKLNPVKTRYSYVDKPVKKKRIAYYTVMCRDGSTSSSSSRRGTCSRHGGVSDWQHPVYETYTENQRQKVAEKYREYGEW